MTTRVADIITRARDTLADPKKERWSDDRLLRLLDEAQKDFARQTSLLKGYVNIMLEPYNAEYTLPIDCWRVTRAHYAGCLLPPLSFEAIDQQDLAWYTRKGDSLIALVFDQRNENIIRCYPIPTEAAIQSDSYTFTPASRFGVVTSLSDYTLDSHYGVVTSLQDSAIAQEIFSSPYGVVTSISETEGALEIFYIRDPKTIADLADELEVSSRWDIALKHYIVGHAFLDDLDTAYQQRGSTSLALYDRELNLAQRTARSDSTAMQQYETSYDGGLRW